MPWWFAALVVIAIFASDSAWRWFTISDIEIKTGADPARFEPVDSSQRKDDDR
jgi:hypothetical protein